MVGSILVVFVVCGLLVRISFHNSSVQERKISTPDAQRQFAKQMNATTISIDASHASYVSHPDEIAKLIIDAVKGSSK